MYAIVQTASREVTTDLTNINHAASAKPVVHWQKTLGTLLVILTLTSAMARAVAIAELVWDTSIAGSTFSQQCEHV